MGGAADQGRRVGRHGRPGQADEVDGMAWMIDEKGDVNVLQDACNKSQRPCGEPRSRAQRWPAPQSASALISRGEANRHGENHTQHQKKFKHIVFETKQVGIAETCPDLDDCLRRSATPHGSRQTQMYWRTFDPTSFG